MNTQKNMISPDQEVPTFFPVVNFSPSNKLVKKAERHCLTGPSNFTMSSVKATYFFAQLNDELLRREKLDNGPASIENTFDLHRGQTSKSLFLFFIAGISFTS